MGINFNDKKEGGEKEGRDSRTNDRSIFIVRLNGRIKNTIGIKFK